MLNRILTEEEYRNLPENLQEDYDATENDEGITYRLVVEGMTHEDDVAGLKSALDKERDNVKDAEAKAKEKQKELDEFNSRLTSMAQEKDSEITSLTEALNKKENQAKDKRDKILGQMSGVLKDKAAIDAIATHDGNPALLLPVLNEKLTTVIDEDGTSRVMAKDEKDDDGKPLTAHALVANLRKDPKFGGAFKGSGSSGSGIISDASIYAAGGANRHTGSGNKRRSQMTPREKVDYVKSHGDKSFQSLPL